MTHYYGGVVRGEKHFRKKRIAIGLEPKAFDEIARRADLEGVSLNEWIRRLIEWGMEFEREYQQAVAQERRLSREAGESAMSPSTPADGSAT